MNVSIQNPMAPRLLALAVALAPAACAEKPPADRVRAAGQIEATDVHVSAQVGGRLMDLRVDEGDRVDAGATIASLDTADAMLGLMRARAEHEQAQAQLRLLRAGARPEEIRQAEAQVVAAESDARTAETELAAAQPDADRFEKLLASGSGSSKQRDDAVARRDIARQRAQSARDRVPAARENLARLKAGARPEEIEAALARVAAAAAQIATWEKAIADATVTAPISGIVTEKVADRGEIVQPRATIIVISDLDRPWANVYVDEPIVPRLRVGQPATIFTDAGGKGVPGSITAIASKAEFTPRNVQTAQDRSKLVYRIKVSVDNKQGLLKAGMPVEADIPLQP